MRRYRCSSGFARAPIAAALAGLLIGVSAPPAAAALLITIDKASQHMTVALDELPVFDWPVSTGQSGYDTPVGDFKPFRMEKTHFSREWDDAPMPHSIFFTQQGHAIHGSYEVKRLGNPASHGCVRLSPQNAATLFAMVKQEGMANTKVVLTGEIPGGGGVPAARRPPRRDFDDDDFSAALPPRASQRAEREWRQLRDGRAFFDGRYFYDRYGRRYDTDRRTRRYRDPFPFERGWR
jgi:hypothetical protein